MELTKMQKNNLNKFVTQAKKVGFLNWTKKVVKEFPKAKIYLVGGAVRDAILQIPTRDYDFVITEVPIKKLEKFLNPLGCINWINLVGRNFGIFKFTPKGFKGKIEPLDIGLPRTEHTIQNLGIYKDFNVQSDHKLPIEEDLKRRDFTINAMALDLTSDDLTIIDEFNGLEDLKNKTIRTVGKPKDRFQEDYSRMLRAIRFACQLDFKIEKETKTNIKKLVKNLNSKKNNEYIIPREILAEQFVKALLKNPLKAFDLFDDLKIFDILIPEMKAMKGCKQPTNYHSEGDVWKHTRLCMKMLNSNLFKNQFKKPITNNEEQNLLNSEVVLVVLLHDIDKPTCSIWVEKKGKKKLQFYNHDVEGGKTAENICNRLKLSAPDKVGIDCKNVNWLIARHMLLIEGKIDKMRQTKVEKYLMSERYPGKNLLKLSYIDAISTIPEDRKIPEKKSDLKNWISLKGFNIALKRIAEIKKLIKNKNNNLPEKLINGDDVMKILKIKSGKKVGTILDKVREEQLNKKIKNKTQAINFIKNKCK